MLTTPQSYTTTLKCMVVDWSFGVPRDCFVSPKPTKGSDVKSQWTSFCPYMGKHWFWQLARHIPESAVKESRVDILLSLESSCGSFIGAAQATCVPLSRLPHCNCTLVHLEQTPQLEDVACPTQCRVSGHNQHGHDSWRPTRCHSIHFQFAKAHCHRTLALRRSFQYA